MMSWCTRSGTARCHASGLGVNVRSQSAIAGSGGHAEARWRGVDGVGSDSPSAGACAPNRIGMIWKSWTRLSGMRPRPPGAARAPYSPEQRGASRTAWRCSSVSLVASDPGRESCGVPMAENRGRLFDFLLQAHLRIGKAARITEELVQLVLVRHPLDGPVGVRRPLVRPQDMGPDKEEQLGAQGLVVTVAQQVADDGDLKEYPQLLAVERLRRALEPAEDDHLVVHDVD